LNPRVTLLAECLSDLTFGEVLGYRHGERDQQSGR